MDYKSPYLGRVEELVLQGEMASFRLAGVGSITVGTCLFAAVLLRGDLLGVGLPVTGLSVAMAVLGAVVFWRSRDVRRHPVFATLRDTPETIVAVKRVMRGAGRDRVVFISDRGDPVGHLAVPREATGRFLVATKNHLPWVGLR
ncbi:MAG: hypothetical protein AAF721_21030 [Myxococcota bacterium]